MSGAGLPATCSVSGDRTVDHHLEPCGEAGRGEHVRGRCVTRRRRPSAIPRRSSSSSNAERPGVGGDAVTLQHLGEQLVLAVAERAHRARARRVAGQTVGQRDRPRGEERADAVVARLAVDVGEVVVLRERWPVAEELVEHDRPCPLVHLGRRRQDPVQVEEEGTEAPPIGGSRHEAECTAWAHVEVAQQAQLQLS